MAVDRFLRFRDLKARGLLSNHVTLGRWIKHEGFPPGMMLGPNTRVWTEAEIEAWIGSRPSEAPSRKAKPLDQRKSRLPLAREKRLLPQEFFRNE